MNPLDFFPEGATIKWCAAYQEAQCGAESSYMDIPNIIIATVFLLGFALAVVLFSKHPNSSTELSAPAPSSALVISPEHRYDPTPAHFKSTARALKREISGLKAEIKQREGAFDAATTATTTATAVNKILEEEIKGLRAKIEQMDQDAAAAKAALRKENSKLISLRHKDHASSEWRVQTVLEQNEALKEQLKTERDRIESLTTLLTQNSRKAGDNLVEMMDWRSKAWEAEKQVGIVLEAANAQSVQHCIDSITANHRLLNDVCEERDSLKSENDVKDTQLQALCVGVKGQKAQIERLMAADQKSAETYTKLLEVEDKLEKEEKLRAKAEGAVKSLREQAKGWGAKVAAKAAELEKADEELQQTKSDLQKAKDEIEEQEYHIIDLQGQLDGDVSPGA